jgi:ADP-heptose:LPS heptosyltransferase
MLAPDARVLVVRLGAIGDCLRVLPALARLRRERPAAHIGWVVEHWVAPLLSGHPLIDELHVVDRRRLSAGLRAAWGELGRVAGEIATRRYDVLLDFHGRAKSGLLGWRTGIPIRAGLASGDSTEFNHLFTNLHVKLEDREESRVLRFLHLLEAVGVASDYDPHDHGLWVEEAVRRRAREIHAQAGSPPVAVYPGTSAPRADERWPADRWVELLRRLAAQGVPAMVLWGPAEAELARGVAEASGAGVVLAPATTLPEMQALIGCCRVFCGSDTAAMHMAWLQGVPTAVFVGPKPPRTVAPLAPCPSRVLQVARHYRPGVSRRRQTPRIVADVAVDDAWRAVHELLAQADAHDAG